MEAADKRQEMYRCRRPLFYAATAMAASIIAAGSLGWRWNLAILACLLFLYPILRKQGRGLLLLLVVLSYGAGSVSFCLTEQRLANDPVLPVLDQSASFRGTVKEAELYQDSRGRDMIRIQTRLRQIRGRDIRGSTVLVRCPADAVREDRPLAVLHPGKDIGFDGTAQLPSRRRNPNTFDYRSYLRTQGIQAVVSVRSLQYAPMENGSIRPDTIKSRLFALREHYLYRLEDHQGEDVSHMLRAILFGDKSQLEDEVQELFQKNGTAHILAVSGLHVGMLYGALAGLWTLLNRCCPTFAGQRKGRRFFLCVTVFFGGYLFLSGYAPSVVRAVLMILAHAFAAMTGRRYDLSSAAFAVALAAMIHNPHVLYQTGFQMSYLAILTLGLITPYIHRFYTGLLTGSLAIQLGLGPYILYQFNVLSPGAVFINVPVIFLAGILVPAGMVGMILPFGTGLWDLGLAGLCRIMILLNDLSCIDQVTTRVVASPPLWMIALFYLGLLVFASEEGRRLILGRRAALLRILALSVLAAALLFGQAVDDGFRKMDLVFVDVGQGDCMHLRSGGRNYLIDGGGSRDYDVGNGTLKPYLLRNGVSRIDGAFVTHLHTDHYKGICELAKAGMVRHLYIYEVNRLKQTQVCEETGLSREAVTFLRQGQVVRLSRGGPDDASDRVEILWPPCKTDAEYQSMIENEEDENASSLIMRVTLKGVSLLATGDLGEEGEAELVKTYGKSQSGEYGSGAETVGTELGMEAMKHGSRGADTEVSAAGAAPALQADILKVGHHGSKTSTSQPFLDAVRPAFAVIQVGERNMYGHPTPEVLDRLADRGIPVWRNDLQGAVGMKLRGGTVREVKTMLQ